VTANPDGSCTATPVDLSAGTTSKIAKNDFGRGGAQLPVARSVPVATGDAGGPRRQAAGPPPVTRR